MEQLKENGTPPVISSSPQSKDEEDLVVQMENSSSTALPTEATKVSFYITEESWKNLTIVSGPRDERQFCKGWTQVFYKAFRGSNLTCPLVFKRHHIRKENSRKCHSHFFTAVAVCKFEGCVSYNFRIKNQPKDGRPIKVKAYPVKPHDMICHKSTYDKARFVAGEDRSNIAEQIKQRGASNIFYDLLGSVEKEALDAGNTSGFGSKQVIQKISSEVNLVNRLHKEVIIEVGILKRVYEREDDWEGAIKGCIQAISFFPFSVILYSGQQLALLGTEIANGNGVLYFDATGKIISKIPSQEKKVFYYPLLLKGKIPGDPPIPVAEFISNSHSTADVSNFLMRLQRDLTKLYPNGKPPLRIEVDYSWALIHAIIISFNREDIRSYLHRAWYHIHGSEEWGKRTKVHICSAHLLHKISGRISGMMKDKTARRQILFVVARMVDGKTVAEVDAIFTSLCVLLLSENEVCHPQFDDSVKLLQTCVNSPSSIADEIEGDSGEEVDESDLVHGTTPSTSVFATHYLNIRERVNSELTCESEKAANIYYCPEFIKYLLGSYMGIVPLWTGLLLEEGVQHDTNSAAENWIKIVKTDILQGKSRMTPTDFIIEMRCNIKGRLREHHRHAEGCSTHHRSSLKKSKKYRKETSDFFSSCEKWGGKKRKKGVYFRSPLKMSTKEKHDSERSLHWGDQLQEGERTVHVTNTCPVDNMLVLFHKVEHSSDIGVCKDLLAIHNFFLSGNWSGGRTFWIRKYCNVPESDSWNLFASEWKQFVQHIGILQETECVSTCSKRRCPRKYRNLVSREITLGDNKERPSISLQDSVHLWERSSTSNCVSGPVGTACRGIRTLSRRTFRYADLPFVVIGVSFLSESRGLKPSQLPADLEIADERYYLFGCTLGNGSHFKGFFLKEETWFQYDGLCNPEITSVPFIDSDFGQIEHVIYVRQ